MESNNFDFAAIWRLIRKNSILFIGIVIVAGVVSAIFSGPYFLEPRFKSQAIMYPINLKEYGEESTTEQLLQMFQATAIRDTIIEKFNLYESYEIEEGLPSSKFYMNIEYGNRVITSKTSYESVKLEVLDEDPVKAKEMADEILVQLTNVLRNFQQARGQSRSEAFGRQMKYQLAVIDSIENEISKISQENNLVEYESQSRELVRGYIQSLSSGKNSEKSKEIKAWLENLEKSGSLYESLQNISKEATKEYGTLTMKFLDWRAIGYEEVHYIDLIVEPEISDKKAWPIRWLIVLLGIVGACFLTLIVLAIKKPS